MSDVGRIIHYQEFVFEDGSKGNKYFVTLNAIEAESVCFVLKTTSQSERYKDVKQGCNPHKKVFYIPAGQVGCFKKDTYIQLPEIFEIPVEDLLAGNFARTIQTIDSLTDDCFQQLKNCLKNFRMDISPYHWKLIFN